MVMDERDETNEHEMALLLSTASHSALAPLSPRHRCVVPQCPAPVQLPDDGILLVIRLNSAFVKQRVSIKQTRLLGDMAHTNEVEQNQMVSSPS